MSPLNDFCFGLLALYSTLVFSKQNSVNLVWVFFSSSICSISSFDEMPLVYSKDDESLDIFLKTYFKRTFLVPDLSISSWLICILHLDLSVCSLPGHLTARESESESCNDKWRTFCKQSENNRAHLGGLLSSFHVLPSSSGWLQHGLEAAHNHPRLKSCLKTTPAREGFRRARLHPESSSPGVTTTETKTSARPFCFQTLTGHYSHERSDLILQPGMSGQSSSCTRSTFSENISYEYNN